MITCLHSNKTMDTKLSLFISLLLLLSACSQNKFIEVKNDEGNLTEKYQVNKDGLKNGLAYSYFSSGEIETEEYYKNGKLDGKRSIFFKSGQTEIEEQYVSDRIHGPYKVYFENGTLSVEVEYIDGKMQGLLNRYYETGDLMEEITMKDNQENGPFKEYYQNGQVQWQGEYLNGENEFGLLQQFDEQGTLIKKMMCDSFAVCQTIWTSEKGDIIPEKIKLTHEKK